MNRKICLIVGLLSIMILCLVLSGCGGTQKYTVRFDANGGVGEATSQTLEVGASASLQANEFVREGYVFVGWSTDKAATTATYADKQSVTELASAGDTITLYAIWSPQPYIVYFDANGGEGAMSPQQIEVGATTRLAANAFTRDGYHFIGWATDKSSASPEYADGQQVADLAQPDGSITLYALWQKAVYTISYNGNGATGGEMYDQNVACAKPTALVQNAFSRGYKYDFLGWATDKNAVEPTYLDMQEVTDIAEVGQVVTLYAVWGEWVVPSRLPQSADDLVIEAANDKGNSDLQADWQVQAYKNAWTDTTASLTLVESYNGTGGVKLSYWNNDIDYRYGKGYKTSADYDTVALDYKGNGISRVRITLAHSEHGVYMTYDLGVAPAVWTHYEISIFDEGWLLNYGGKTISVEEGIKAISLSGYYDVIKWFDTLRITLRGSTANGANAYSYLDNVALMQTLSQETTSSAILFDFGGTYTAEVNGTVVKATFSSSDVCFETLNLADNLTLTTDYTQQGNSVTFSGTANGQATIIGNGEALTVSTLGGIGSLLDGAELHKVYTVDDFEGYAQTGIGLDTANADADNVSGLRGGYYAEYYTNEQADTAPVGGKKWSLMSGDVNYVELSTTSHGGKQSMQLVSQKNGNARYITMSAASGGAKVIGKGTTLGFWVKNISGGDIQIRQAYVSYRDTLNSDNITNTTTTSVGSAGAFTIPVGSDWTLCEVAVDATKDVYGIVLVLQENYSAERYLLVDDVALYTASPFASYVDSTKPQMPEYASIGLDFEQLTSGTDYNGTDWKREVLSSAGWSEISGQMRVRQNVSGNNVLNMYTRVDNCYRYTYVGEGVGLGKANYFSIDLGNYFQTPSDVKIKIMLVDSGGEVHYALGTAEEYYVLSSTKGDSGEQQLTTFEYEFEQITVMRVIIEIKGTNGDQYVYMDNVRLSYVQ